MADPLRTTISIEIKRDKPVNVVCVICNGRQGLLCSLRFRVATSGKWLPIHDPCAAQVWGGIRTQLQGPPPTREGIGQSAIGVDGLIGALAKGLGIGIGRALADVALPRAPIRGRKIIDTEVVEAEFVELKSLPEGKK